MKSCRSAGWKRFWRLPVCLLSDPNQNRNQKLRMNRMAETSIFLVACAHACDFVVVVVVVVGKGCVI